ncbi:hypothetical protein NDU88_003600 [Pleurodeles waltl]|uniref:Uncharacterized protein n=1 Tax=Pleurodeles waltl TaxID=8319 RepID=A0AAV7MRM2_PLEWA|nr:hypothetical protein NDU88_003600 [Pleurodeles waltl]
MSRAGGRERNGCPVALPLREVQTETGLDAALVAPTPYGSRRRIEDLERALRSDGGDLGRQLVLLHAEFRQVSLVEDRQHWQASTPRVYELRDKTRKLLY